MKSLAILAAVAFGAASARAAAPHGMFDLYEANRAEGRPNWITEDFVLLGYSMTLDSAMGEVEEQVLLPESLRIVDGMARFMRRAATDAKAFKGASDFLAWVRVLLAGGASNA